LRTTVVADDVTADGGGGPGLDVEVVIVSGRSLEADADIARVDVIVGLHDEFVEVCENLPERDEDTEVDRILLAREWEYSRLWEARDDAVTKDERGVEIFLLARRQRAQM
jgi:hypothetical protein